MTAALLLRQFEINLFHCVWLCRPSYYWEIQGPGKNAHQILLLNMKTYPLINIQWTNHSWLDEGRCWKGKCSLDPLSPLRIGRSQSGGAGNLFFVSWVTQSKIGKGFIHPSLHNFNLGTSIWNSVLFNFLNLTYDLSVFTQLASSYFFLFNWENSWKWKN